MRPEHLWPVAHRARTSLVRTPELDVQRRRNLTQQRRLTRYIISNAFGNSDTGDRAPPSDPVRGVTELASHRGVGRWGA